MEKSRPLLSIAIPTYNGSRTIKRMMDVLLEQVDERVEVFVADNCSTDSTSQIISEYQRTFPFVDYFRNEKNIGADGNFLSCMRNARGKYVYLLSDDDVLTEGSLKIILNFLESNPEMGLIYLGTGNFYSHYAGKENCTTSQAVANETFCSKDKTMFMEYAKYYWGFVSSFILNTDRFRDINNPEQYFGTYWLQSYIHILCASGDNTFLGIVNHLCVGAGVYITQSNFDTSYVDGISYRKMLDCAIDNGFDKKQLDRWYINRLSLLASHGIIKEKAAGNRKIDKKQLFLCTRNYWQAWIKIYPMMFVPNWVCKAYMKYYRRKKGVDYESNLNRAGDVSTDYKG